MPPFCSVIVLLDKTNRKGIAPFEESYLDSFTKIIIAYLQAKRLRISDIANSMGSILHKKGNNADKIDETSYKAIQRLLNSGVEIIGR